MHKVVAKFWYHGMTCIYYSEDAWNGVKYFTLWSGWSNYKMALSKHWSLGNWFFLNSPIHCTTEKVLMGDCDSFWDYQIMCLPNLTVFGSSSFRVTTINDENSFSYQSSVSSSSFTSSIYIIIIQGLLLLLLLLTLLQRYYCYISRNKIK